MTSVVKQLVALRKQLKLRPTDVAKSMKVSRQQVYNIENAKNPRILTLIRYAHALGYEIVYAPKKGR